MDKTLEQTPVKTFSENQLATWNLEESSVCFIIIYKLCATHPLYQ